MARNQPRPRNARSPERYHQTREEKTDLSGTDQWPPGDGPDRESPVDVTDRSDDAIVCRLRSRSENGDVCNLIGSRELYAELHALARWHFTQQHASHTLQPTALVHEAWLKLRAGTAWKSHAHFIAVASVAMRQVLIDHARRKSAAKRGTGEPTAMLVSAPAISDAGLDVLMLDELVQKLAQLQGRAGKVAHLKVFGGLTNEQVGNLLGISAATASNDWSVARAWLLAQLRGDESPESTHE